MDSKGNPHTKLWLYVPKLFKVVDGKIVDMVATISDVSKILNITRVRAKLIVTEIRNKNKKYYSDGLHGLNKINPLHLAPYLELTREEMIAIIYNV